MTTDVGTIITELSAYSNDIDVTDREYFCPSVKWLAAFGHYIKQHRGRYIPEKFDCENFANWARFEADRAAAKNPRIRTGHTFGVMDVGIVGSVNHHRLNVVRCNNNIWYAFEPQTGKYQPLALYLDTVPAWAFWL